MKSGARRTRELQETAIPRPRAPPHSHTLTHDLYFPYVPLAQAITTSRIARAEPQPPRNVKKKKATSTSQTNANDGRASLCPAPPVQGPHAGDVRAGEGRSILFWARARARRVDQPHRWALRPTRSQFSARARNAARDLTNRHPTPPKMTTPTGAQALVRHARRARQGPRRGGQGRRVLVVRPVAAVPVAAAAPRGVAPAPAAPAGLDAAAAVQGRGRRRRAPGLLQDVFLRSFARA